jgi:Ca2+-binding RTX toxin-like protein
MSITPLGNSGATGAGNSVTTSTDQYGRTIIDAGKGNDNIEIFKGKHEGMYLVRINGRDQHLTEAELRNTVFRGGKGDDRIIVAENVTVPVTIEGGDGDDILYGGAGNDKISGGDGNDFIYGHDGQDIIDGGRGRDEIHGGKDGDIIYGGSGNDKIFGGEGIDHIMGNQGNDYIDGGAGRDIIEPGKGDNTIRMGYDGVIDEGLKHRGENGRLKILPPNPPPGQPPQ